jgi:hypothetical protein
VINVERGLGRIGIVFLFFAAALLAAIFAWVTIYGQPDWSNWPAMVGLFLLYAVGVPLFVFLFSQVFRWVLRGFRQID